eukprot:XP_001709655.1 Hypothetical protein GL50803_92985 [Giardia lamblia ATCC 50803]
MRVCLFLRPSARYYPVLGESGPRKLSAHLLMRLLSKSRLPPAHEPPAEEAHEAPHDDDHGDGDPRDGPRGEPAPVGARGHTGGPTAV